MATTTHGQLGRCTYRNTYRSQTHRREPLSSPLMDLVGLSRSEARAFDRTHTHTGVRGWILWMDYLGRRFPGSKLGFTDDVPEGVFSQMSANLKLMPLAKLLYSVSEAAELLSCSKSTVYGLIRSGELVSVHATSRTRISAAALVRYVQLKEADAYVERRAQRRATR